MSITEEIGNGAASRREVYELIQDVIGHEIPEDVRKKIKNIMLDYAVRVQDDGIQRMQKLASENNLLRERFQMLQTGSHTICQKCGTIRIKKYAPVSRPAPTIQRQPTRAFQDTP